MRIRTSLFRLKWVSFLAAPSLILGMVSCQTGIAISVWKDCPPIFSVRSNLSDVNEFPAFFVLEVIPENINLPISKRAKKDNLLWKIIKEDSAVIRADTIGTITYGKLPPGFRQEVPASGRAPNLGEGKIYEASGMLILMPEAIVRFTIRDRNVVELPMPK